MMGRSLSDVFSGRHHKPGWVYIQGSKQDGLLKFGITINLHLRPQRNKAEKYGGSDDWKLLYWVWVENSGRVESDALSLLKQFKVPRTYSKDGVKPQKAREIVKCDFSIAVEAIEKVLSKTERMRASLSNDTYDYEFSVRTKEHIRNLYRRDLRPPKGMPQKSLWFLNVTELEISVRSENCLLNDGIKYVGSLIQKTEAEILRTPNLGRKSFNEIQANLRLLNLDFGTQIPDWPPADLDSLSERIAPFLNRVDELELSIRSMNNLHRAHIFYVGELVQYSERQIRSDLMFGGKSLVELRTVLAEMRMTFGMDFKVEPDLTFAN